MANILFNLAHNMQISHSISTAYKLCTYLNNILYNNFASWNVIIRYFALKLDLIVTKRGTDIGNRNIVEIAIKATIMICSSTDIKMTTYFS